MNTQRLIATAAACLSLASFGGAALAESNDDMSFSGMFKMDRIDVNKDGMVSKAEFMDTMGKVYDMKAKEMKSKPDGMNAAEFKQMFQFLSRGEKNK
jgi:hypothetical protein